MSDRPARRPPAASASPTKGEQTRAAILDTACKISSRDGLDQITIGGLADATGMSKSGLFAHFGSREELQLAVLARGEELFAQNVVVPALKEPRGVPRLRALFTHWLEWTDSAALPGGCIMLGAAAEFDDRPGVVRDALVRGQRAWMETLKKAVRLSIEEGHLAPDTDTEQFAFECFGVALAYHYHRRLLGDARARRKALAAHDALIDRHRAVAARRVRALSR
jgi:AcrR family transcriptional regulator